MLEEIKIQNLGIINNTTLPFTKGLTVITGETGAGKTMILTALNLLLGKRVNSSIIKTGATHLSVEGCWDTTNIVNTSLEQVEETGAIIEDNQLFINRTLQTSSKSRAVVGGKSVPATTLVSIGEKLVNIHGQADQMRLKNVSAQQETLDKYAGQKLSVELNAYKTLLAEHKRLTQTLKDIETNKWERERKFEHLTYCVNEIETVNPTSNEDMVLKQQISTLTNVEEIKSVTETVNQLLQSDSHETTNMLTLITTITKNLHTIQQYNPEIVELAEQADTVKTLINELAANVSIYSDSIDTTQIDELNTLQERLAQIVNLTKKYGGTIEEVHQFLLTSKKELETLNPENSNTQKLTEQLNKITEQLTEQAQKVSAIRTQKSVLLTQKVNTELEGLAMHGNKLHIEITPTHKFTPTGTDNISFTLQTGNNTQNFQPITKAASGGELSRIMLALEVVLADPKQTPTFVFDEVDSGVGGATATEIGKRLAQLAKEAQVIVVTHLPQVAAFADNHLLVTKNMVNNITETTVKQLTTTEETEELTRMLSGLTHSESGKQHAKELKTVAEQYKQNLTGN